MSELLLRRFGPPVYGLSTGMTRRGAAHERVGRAKRLQIRAKPTEGFEPSTPALRERCSGQLSYVGVRGRV
jgi:hypothetical protein